MNLKFYVGWDSRQPEAAQVCRASLERWLDPNDIVMIRLSEVEHCYYREWDPRQATEFSFTRFLVPYLNQYQGWAVFCDSDFLWQQDPRDLIRHLHDHVAVSVVQHDIQPEHLTQFKMDHKVQVWYPRKNWSSLMLFNCAHDFCKTLDPDTVSTAPASYLHQLEWAQEAIGSLPTSYNHLVGYYSAEDNVHAYHFTDGTPLHEGYENCQHSEVWWQQYHQMTKV